MAELDDIFAPLPKVGGAAPPAAGSLDAIFAPLAPIPGTTTNPGQTALDTMRGRDPAVDYTVGAPLHQRLDFYRSSNKREEELYLKNTFGAGNYKQDRGGTWLFRTGEADPWKPVYPAGVMEGINNLGVGLVGSIPTTGGALAGAGLGGALMGPPGAAGGAFIGGVSGKALDELAKWGQGNYDKTPGELHWELGKEGALASMFQGAGPAWNAMKGNVFNAMSRPGGWLGSVTQANRDVVHSLEPYGVTPPIQSVAPGLKALEYDRFLRNTLMADPKERGRLAAVDTRMREILGRFGIVGNDLDNATMQITDKMTATSGTDTGRAVARALHARETMLSGEERVAKEAAETALQRHTDTFRRSFRQDTGDLGGDVARTLREEHDAFRTDMNDAYSAITRMTGDQQIVHKGDARRFAARLLDTMDPQSVPPILRRLADDSEKHITFEQAHNIRTALREMAGTDGLLPPGLSKGNLRRMAALVDDAMTNAEGQVGQDAARLLREADTRFHEGIVRFTNPNVTKIIEQVSAGRTPDAETISGLLLDKRSVQATRQIWDMLPSELQGRVQTADLSDMLTSISQVGANGRMTINPDALLKALDEKERLLNFVYNKSFLNSLRDLALNFKALKGDIDVSSLPRSNVTLEASYRAAGLPGTDAVRRSLQEALAARRALESEARTNPRIALRSDNPEMIDAGARYFIAPGNEARTLAGRDMLGANSPEWQQVQRQAVVELLKSAIVPKGLGRTIAGGSLEDTLGGLTRAQQNALFPAGARDDIVLLAQQAKALFPELEKSYGASMAAANIMGHLPSLAAIRAHTWSRFAGMLADSPTLAKMLAGQLRNNPYQGRAMLSYLMQYGADVGQQEMSKTQMLGPRTEFDALFKPTMKQPIYGGVSE